LKQIQQSVVTDYLKQCPLFHELSSDKLVALVKKLTIREFSKDQVVLGLGGAPDTMGVLMGGQLKAVAFSSSGREVGFSMIRPVRQFGELALIDGQPRSAAVIAVERSLVAFIPKNTALQLMTHEPSVSSRMMVSLAQLIRRCNQQILLLGYQQAHSRICALLLRSSTENTSEGLKVLDFPSQREAASLTNTSRETVSRVLKQLQDAGILHKQGKQLWILDREHLERVVLEGKVPE
jgi:CRP/FNR family cyclic AMP-dependent transcriptional regulator